MKIAILALQGNYSQHQRMLNMLGVHNELIRYPNALSEFDGLIIPGGESTVISKQIENNNFRKAIIKFSKNKPIFGTCAGMILLSSMKSSENVAPLNIMNYDIKRNAWGRQINSFSVKILININSHKSFNSFFIRSPKIKNIGSNIKIIATFNNEPVLLEDKRHIVSSFHPEIGNDSAIHKYYINKIKKNEATIR